MRLLPLSCYKVLDMYYGVRVLLHRPYLDTTPCLLSCLQCIHTSILNPTYILTRCRYTTRGPKHTRLSQKLEVCVLDTSCFLCKLSSFQLSSACVLVGIRSQLRSVQEAVSCHHTSLLSKMSGPSHSMCTCHSRKVSVHNSLPCPSRADLILTAIQTKDDLAAQRLTHKIHALTT